MRHHVRLQVLLPALATLAAACGGGTTGEVPAASSTSSSGGASSSSSTSSSGGSSTSSSTSSGGGTTLFELDVCTGTEYKRTEGLTGTTAIDFFSFREEYDGSTGAPQIVSESGTPCNSGPDAAKCKTDLGSLRSEKGWQRVSFGLDRPGRRYLVTTAADKITTAVTVADATKLLAPIETGYDAAFVATATDQYRFVCDGSKNAKQTPEGWELKVESGTDCGADNKVEGHTLLVAADGTVTVKQTTLIKAGDPGCVFGRRPEGLVAAADCESGDPVGAFFAAAAHLEAASVLSFERLADELTMLGAPSDSSRRRARAATTRSAMRA